MDKQRTLVAAALVIATALAAIGLTRITIDDQVRNLFRTEDGRLEKLQEIYQQFGSDDLDCYLVIEADDLFADAARSALHELIAELTASEVTESVLSPLSAPVFTDAGVTIPLIPPGDADPAIVEQARAIARSHPVATGRMITADGRTALAVIKLIHHPSENPFLESELGAIQPIIDRFNEQTDLTLALTGLVPIRNEMVSTLETDTRFFLLLSSLVGAMVSLVLFRRISAVIIVTVAAIVGAVWTLGIMGWIGEPINPVNSVAPTIVMIVGYTDAVHLLHAIRGRLADGDEPRDAVMAALRLVGPACALTSLTTAIGFGSLLTAQVDVIQRFGMIAAIGSLMSFLSVVTCVPLLSGTLLGDYLRPRSIAQRPWGPSLREAVFARVSHAILQRKRLITLGGIALSLALIAISTRVQPSSFLREGVPQSSVSARAVERIDERFGGLLTLLMLVEWDQTAIDDETLIDALGEIERIAESHDLISNATSLHTLLDALPEIADSATQQLAILRMFPATAPWVERLYQPDEQRAVVVGFMPDGGSHAHTPVLKTLTEQLAAFEQNTPGIAITLSGTPVVIGQSANQMISDLLGSLVLATLVIFGVMSVSFRSIRLGFVCILPNAFPLLVAAAWLVLWDRALTVTGVITFCVCLGIAVDDTIHIVTRFRILSRQGMSVEDALHRTMIHVGGALLTTTAVLLGGLGTLLLSTMPLVHLFGELACVGLAAAYLGDVIILPAMLGWFIRPAAAVSTGASHPQDEARQAREADHDDAAASIPVEAEREAI